MPKKRETMMTVGQFARELRRPIRTVRDWCVKGYIRSIRTPPEGWYQIPRSELDRVRKGIPLEHAA